MKKVISLWNELDKDEDGWMDERGELGFQVIL